MLEFVFTILLMVSLSFVLYLMVLALPRVAEAHESEKPKSLLDRWAHSHVPEKIDAALNSFFLKLLWRTKITVLKLDNALGKHLQKVKPKEGEKKQIDFKDIKNSSEEGREE